MAANGKAKDLTCQQFGLWSVLRMSEKSNHGHRHYDCLCACGKTKILRGSMLTSGKSISCGCANINNRNTKHNMSYSYTYRSWTSMKTRCLNFMDSKFPMYGGRGIRICDRWLESFSNFFEDMGERPKDMTIDRIDNSKGYYKENCRWATKMEQTLNRGETIWVEHENEVMCITHLCRKFKISRGSLEKRMNNGMSLDEALKTPKRKKGCLVSLRGSNGIYKCDFLDKYKLSETTLYRLTKSGKKTEDALALMLRKKGIDCDTNDISLTFIENTIDI